MSNDPELRARYERELECFAWILVLYGVTYYLRAGVAFAATYGLGAVNGLETALVRAAAIHGEVTSGGV